MDNPKLLEEKISNIDKTILGIDTTIKYFSERLAETARINSTELENHNNRIIVLERTFNIYDGSIKTLNKLISLGGVFIISGIIWLFIQANEYKRDYVLIHNQQQQNAKELDYIRNSIETIKYDSINKSTNTH